MRLLLFISPEAELCGAFTFITNLPSTLQLDNRIYLALECNFYAATLVTCVVLFHVVLFLQPYVSKMRNLGRMACTNVWDDTKRLDKRRGLKAALNQSAAHVQMNANQAISIHRVMFLPSELLALPPGRFMDSENYRRLKCAFLLRPALR